LASSKFIRNVYNYIFLKLDEFILINTCKWQFSAVPKLSPLESWHWRNNQCCCWFNDVRSFVAKEGCKFTPECVAIFMTEMMGENYCFIAFRKNPSYAAICKIISFALSASKLHFVPECPSPNLRTLFFTQSMNMSYFLPCKI
jgi:hypothetical protein